MKKVLAMLCAAIFVIAAAGCVHKNPAPDISDPNGNATQDASSPTEENGSVNVATEPTKTVTLPDGSTQTQESTKRYSKITLITTRAPSPDRLTQRPSTTARTTNPPAKPPSTAVSRTTKPTTTVKPTTTKPHTTQATTAYKGVTVEYGGTYGTDKDKVRIKSHEVTLSDNDRILVTLQFEIVAASGTAQYVYIGYNCYDAAGNKINDEPVRTIAPVNTTSAASTSIATAPKNTAKIIFVNI